MNLDDLVNSVPEAQLRDGLSQWDNEWKEDDNNIDHLAYLIDKWHGNIWFKGSDTSNELYDRFQEFKHTAIDGIGGLTLNERLYWFGLFESWDCAGDEHQERI